MLFCGVFLANSVLGTQRKEGFSWTLTGQKFKLNFPIFPGEMTWIWQKEEFTNPLPTAMFPSLLPLIFGEELKPGSLLRGSLDKCVRIDLPFPLSVPTPPPTLPTPFPFSLISTGKPPPTTHLNPTPNPFPETPLGTRTPLRKLPPVRATP